jgi:hypothetical protein
VVWQALDEHPRRHAVPGPATTRTLSWEPPWRWVEEVVDGAPVTLYQATMVIRDDGTECHLVGAFVADPGEDPGAPAFLDEAQQVLTGFVEDLARAAERARDG